MERGLRLSVLALMAAIALAGCNDPVELRQGLYGDVVLSMTGWSERDFVVHVRDREGSSALVARVNRPQAIRADWLDDRRIEVFILGGSITDCDPRPLGFRVSLHRMDEDGLSRGLLPDGGSTAQRFRTIPDTCSEY
jgi:hypothetical protein